MPKPGQWNKEETVRAWADITLKIWRERITELKAWDTGELYKSLENALFTAAGNDVDKVEFSFKLYGVFVDMGVGREIFKGNDGDVGYDVVRKRKEWYSRVFYREVMRLKEILVEKFGEQVASQIVFAMHPVNDLKYEQARSKKIK
ncbi:hypothetical protein [Mangrovibacterium sp.]|uniref:hypothetical protein n=1 Tax=Mangrovibacterium sp. TaxID=1961364 RepID=UPI00356B45D6